MRQEDNFSPLKYFLQLNPLTLFLLIQAMIVLIGYSALNLNNNINQAYSFLIGSALILSNLIVLSVAWALVVEKKLIALSASIIVFKYALLGAIVYRVLKLDWISTGWFSVGITSLILTVFVFIFLKPLVLKNIDEDEQ